MHETRFSRLLTNFNLVDTWRHLKPQARKYLCFSTTHNIMSRIDLILLSRALLPRLQNVTFGPRHLSDHCSYWITLSANIDKPSRSRRLNPFWLSLIPEDGNLLNEWKQYFLDNDPSASAFDSVEWRYLWRCLEGYGLVLNSLNGSSSFIRILQLEWWPMDGHLGRLASPEAGSDSGNINRENQYVC